MRSVKVKIFGITVYEYIDDSAENVIDIIQGLVEDTEEPVVDDGSFVLPGPTYVDPEPEGHVINPSPEE